MRAQVLTSSSHVQVMLIETGMIKIASLLRLGFGEAGLHPHPPPPSVLCPPIYITSHCLVDHTLGGGMWTGPGFAELTKFKLTGGGRAVDIRSHCRQR